jgi:hypothetical protein
MVPMALPFPTSRRLDGPGDLQALALAIAGASPDEPETDALEWKGSLDLASRKSRYDLARHILGFGNRSVPVAQESFDGYAYLLLGVTPGAITGVDMPDPADLQNALASYIAASHPAWSLHRVRVDGSTVAVIEVNPPSDGDRICTLLAGGGDARAGRIFVRRHGQTEEASPAEVRMLEDRYAAAAHRAREIQERNARAAEQSLELDRAREARELEDRAERQRPNFVTSRLEPKFSYISPDRVQGIVRNAGGSAAEIYDLRIHLPGAAVPGSAVSVFGEGPVGDFGLPVRVDQGAEVMLRFVSDITRELDQYQGPLTIELWFSSDAGLRWLQKLTLRGVGTDHTSGRRQWTVRHDETETARTQ